MHWRMMDLVAEKLHFTKFELDIKNLVRSSSFSVLLKLISNNGPNKSAWIDVKLEFWKLVELHVNSY